MNNHDINYTEIRHLQQIETAKKLQANPDFNVRQSTEATICLVIIMLLTVIAGFFN